MSIVVKNIIDTGNSGGGITLPIQISDVANLQNSLDNKLNLADFNEIRVFARRFFTNTPGTIAGNTTIRILDRLQVDSTTGYEPNLTSTYIFTTGTNAFVQEIVDNNLIKGLLFFEFRFSRATAIGNTILEVRMIRRTNNSLVNGIQVGNADSDGRILSGNFNSDYYGATDPFVTAGYYFEVKNLTGTALNYDSCAVKVAFIRERG